jgi:hypothetical protein
MCKDLITYRLLLHRWKPWFEKLSNPRLCDVGGRSYDDFDLILASDKSFSGLIGDISNGLLMTVIVSVLIWCLVLFDIVGIKVGVSQQSIGVVVILGTTPWILLVLKKVVNGVVPSFIVFPSHGNTRSQPEIELTVYKKPKYDVFNPMFQA